MQRWKIERFHYVLKSGCAREKLQERSIEKTAVLILMYSIIAGKILNMTYAGRLTPELPCSLLLGEDEWKLLYCIANKVKKEHGVVASQVPWVRHGAGFTCDFENMVAWLTLHCSMSVVAQMMRIAWNTVGQIVGRVHQDMKGGKPGEHDGLIRIGIDETAYKKGHKYMTVVVNHGTGRLVWAGKGTARRYETAFSQAWARGSGQAYAR
jgi:transposase